ncbi:HNH endonuclease [Acuticoccus sediminis]|uniref:HNH endonuclease n=1 Tax=Acuticoccus sediminis TaxID=2184697 RepID=A0A8B2NNL6_9HYPH|nr:HNH endonuclease signature motif containing protein [Acuticoccus sediminis]RAH99858.1 HNH endonuclease [Acuticoccus sediminis]
MPYAAPRHCPAGHPPFTGPSCPQCTARRNANAEARRPSSRARGYDSTWDKARAAFLAEHPRCVRCGAAATVVDHVVAHRGDQSLFWRRSNWQAMCGHCHSSAKQSEEKRGGGSELSRERPRTGGGPSRAIPSETRFRK